MSSAELPKARIVIADDDVENARTIETALKAVGHQTRVVADGEAALHLVRSWSPHVVVLDVNMPKLNGLAALEKIRALSPNEYVAVVLVTANSELESIVAGLDAGADDYIVKPYRLDELRARVHACLRTKVLHDSLRRANKRLEDAANTDDLTSLYNMRFATRRLSEEVESAKKSATPISCLIFDMDNFKGINDKQDHLFGSHVLREVAQVIQPLLRSADLAARFGGDEFFILLPNTKTKEAFELAERMRKQIEGHIFKAGAFSVRVTASFGVAGAESKDNQLMLDARELLRSADSSLSKAKAKGRNCTETFGIV